MDKKSRLWRSIFITTSFLVFSLGLAAQQRPNFVLFITDDIGWGDLACYGNPDVNTPNADQMALEGLKFDNVYLTTSSCSPSRASIITGRYPHNTGAPELHDPLPANQVMFPKLLKDAGYYTILSGKNHMGPYVNQAFDSISTGKGPGGEEDWINIIKDRPKEKPFFFWFASHDAHRDWQFDDKGKHYNPDSLHVPPMLYNGPRTRQDLAGYYHEISRADYYLGQLIEELKRQEIYENTYIIFMSDNGSPFPGNKVRLYDRGIKTPFLITGPGIVPGINKDLVSSIDIAPAIIELAGIKKEERFQGVSFSSILKGSKKPVRDLVFAEHNWHVFKGYERMVRFQNWVYIRNGFPENRNLAGESTRMFPAGDELWEAHEKGLTVKEQEDVFLQPRPAEELYNLEVDFHQFHNLASDKKHKKRLRFLRKIMDKWIEETGDSKPQNPTPDRDDIYGKRLPEEWKKGEKPGEINNATDINDPGPILIRF